MANRCGDRFQLALFPPSIEDYVVPNDPVRAYVVPSQRQVLHEEEGPFSKSHF